MIRKIVDDLKKLSTLNALHEEGNLDITKEQGIAEYVRWNEASFRYIDVLFLTFLCYYWGEE